VQADLPEWLAREGIELAAAGALGEARRGEGDMSLQHPGIALPHLRAGLADHDGAGDVRRAVEVLAAAVDQIEFARLQLSIAFRRDPIVDDRAVGTRAGNGVEGEVAEMVALGPEASQLRGRC